MNTIKCGIYCITNKINSKKYIGQSIDIQRRWMQHKQKNVIARDTFLYKAFIKYGVENFDFSIIELCNEDSLNDREIYWISHYDTYKHGYNMTIGGSGNNSGERKYSQNKIPKNFKNNICCDIDDIVQIVKLDKDYNVLDIYNSVQECSRVNNIIATNISKTAKALHKTCCGFIFMYYNDIMNMNKEEIKEYRLNQRKSYNYLEHHSTSKKCIKVFTVIDNAYVGEFESIQKASIILSVDTSSITKVCKGRLKQSKGYIFQYVA